MKKILTIYEIAPIWIQNVFISLYGLTIRRKLYGKRYRYYLEQMTRNKFTDLNSLKKNQYEELKNIINYSIKHSKFYKEFYKDVKLENIKSIEDINILPILDKDILRNNIENIYTISKKGNFVSRTGGTTGKSLTIIFSKDDVFKRNAFLDHFKLQHGFVNLKMKTARFMGRKIIPANQKKKIYWRTNWPLKLRYYSSFYINQENIPFYIADLNRYKPDAIDGFISNIFEIAKYIKEHKVELTFRPIAIFPTAETVLPIQREIISEVFGCPVRNQYASNEGAPFITECSKGNLHERISTGVFEHIKTKSGMKLIVTSFNTYGTPIIRYDIGDYIIESEGANTNCSCIDPVVLAIDGRKQEYLQTNDNRVINLTALSIIIQNFPSCIINTQFIQKDLNIITIKIVVDTGIFKDEHKDQIVKNMQYVFGDKMIFIIEQTDKIEREPSGKYSLIKNYLIN